LNSLYTITRHFLKRKLNPSQCGFSKAKRTTTNFVTYLNFISLLVRSHLRLILFILTLAMNLTLYCIMFYFKNFVPMGFQMVMQTGSLITLLADNLLYTL